MSTLSRLLGHVRPHAGRVVAGALAASVAAAAGALFSWLLGPLLEALLLNRVEVPIGPWNVSRDRLAVVGPLAVLGAAGVKAVASWLHAGWLQQVAQRVLERFRVELYDRLLSLPPAWFENRHSGELLARFTSDIAQLETSVSGALATYLKDTLQVLALLVLCLSIDVRLFLLAFVVLPLTLIPISRFAKALKRTATKSQGSLATLTQLAAEQLQALPVVQAFNAEDRALKRFDDEQSRYLAVMKKSLFIRGAFTPTLEVMGVLGVALCLFVGVRYIQVEPQLAPKLLTFLSAALLMYQPLKALSGTGSQLLQGLASAKRLFEVLDAAPSRSEGLSAAPLSRALTLEGVTVRYADGRKGLDALTLEFPAGKTSALVGASGAGKSTTLSLLLGFNTPEQGSLKWDGADTSSLSLSSLRAQIAWVPQEPVLLSGSIRDNLRLAKPSASDEQLWTALRRARADEFVRSFSGGLEEDVGERGARLSGGQRQRLAIARAFLREPSLLLLDEPTSALDADTEEKVRAGLAELSEGRTVIVVAHRLSTVQHADRIFVLGSGRLVEAGTHAELIAHDGAYARQVKLLK